MHISLQHHKRTSFYYTRPQLPRYKKTGVVAMDILGLTLRRPARLGVRLHPRTTLEEANRMTFLGSVPHAYSGHFISTLLRATVANTYNYDGTFVLPAPSTLAVTCNWL